MHDSDHRFQRQKELSSSVYSTADASELWFPISQSGGLLFWAVDTPETLLHPLKELQGMNLMLRKCSFASHAAISEV